MHASDLRPTALLEHGATMGPAGAARTAALASVGCLGIALLLPSGGASIPCPLLATTGIDCPGCGITRGTRALLSGDIARAADHNLLLVVALPVLLVVGALAVARRAGALPNVRVAGSTTAWGIGASILVAAFWALRVAGPASLAWLDSGLS